MSAQSRGGNAAIRWVRKGARRVAAALAGGVALVAVAAILGVSPANPPAPQPGVPATSPTTRPATAPAVLGRPDPRPLPPPPDSLTDEQIGAAIGKGSDWLFKQFDPRTHIVGRAANEAAAKKNGIDEKDLPAAGAAAITDSFTGGVDALAVYALLQSGLSLRDDDPRLVIRSPEMAAMLDVLRKADMAGGRTQTYAHGLRSTALALVMAYRASAPPSGVVDEDRRVIEQDARWCLYACNGGAYDYDTPPEAPRDDRALLNQYAKLQPNAMPHPAGPWDNSNSQYGLLGAWSAAEAGVDVPLPYWALVDHHWTDCQRRDGTWDYGEQEQATGSLAMTCAGLASLLVTHDYLVPAVMSGQVARDPFSPAVARGLDWFERGDHAVDVGDMSQWWGYTIYGVERVGLASGFKHFGGHNWYRELAKAVVNGQAANGSWTDDPVNTAYALLFLARGRHPVVMNKLRFDGAWANRPRDAAGLARYSSKALERPLNWQVVRNTTDWQEWTDSPILSIASHVAPKLSKDDLDKLRNFVEAGGMLFTQADGDSAAFNAFAAKLGKDLFGQELANVPPNHPLLTTESVYSIKTPLGLKMITNGARIVMLHAPKDVTRWWQQRDEQRHKAEFELGVNLFVYAAGKRDLRNRIDSAWVAPAATAAPVSTVKVARLQYAGNWDPEPGAWRRYANWFQRQTSYKLDVATVKLDALKPADAPLAVLTGTARQNWNAESVAAVKAYVDAGGVLLVDMAGGSGQFDQSARDLLKSAFPGAFSSPAPPTHPVFAARASGAADLTHRRLRAAAAQLVGRAGGGIEVMTSGKGHVLFSPLDLTCGLLGTNTGGIIGYEPNYAQALVKNIVFWKLDGQPDK